MSKFTHDLNNLLTVIQGYSELARTRLTDDHPARADLDEVIQAASQAIRLVGELGTAESGIAPLSPAGPEDD
jgi:signal transduction histidine kinase